MSLIAQRLQTKLAPTPRSYNSTPAGSTPNYQLLNGRLVAYDDNKITYLNKGYDLNDIIYSIITLVMDKIRVAPWGVYKIKDEQAYGALKGMQKKSDWGTTDYTKAAALQHKALEMVKNPGRLGDLMKFPNDEETMSDLVANGAGFKLLTGDTFVWANILKAGANAGLPIELWLLPSQYTNIYSTDTFPSRITGYDVNIWPDKKYLPSEVLHTKYWNPGWSVQGSQHYGVAPLKAALRLIQRNNSSMTASAATFQNEGVKGILYMDNQVGNVDGAEVAQEVSKMAATLRTEWQGERNRNKMGLSGYTMGWLPVGLNSDEMQLIESEKWDLRRLCSVFGIQSQLLNDPDNKTYANAEEAEKSLTTRAALPQLTSFRDNFNRKLTKDWGNASNIICDFDLSVYSELQQDTKEMVAWLTPLMDKGLPLNRVLELLQLETLKEKEFNEPWITQGMGQPYSEWQLTPVENELNANNSNSAGAGEGNL